MSQLTITLDDELLAEARRLTGIYSDKALLEYALQFVIAVYTTLNHEGSPLSVGRYGCGQDVV